MIDPQHVKNNLLSYNLKLDDSATRRYIGEAMQI